MVRIKRKKYQRHDWGAVHAAVRDGERQGQSVQDVLASLGVDESNYYRAIRAGRVGKRGARATTGRGRLVTFVPAGMAGVTVTTKHGVTISVPGGDTAALRAVLEAIKDEDDE